MSNISILLVTGSFVPPEVYDTVVNAVRANDIEIRALHSPTVGLNPREGREGVPPTMYDDAAFIGQEIDNLADQGKHVILVAHSYGGVPASQSVQGRTIADRRKQGKSGGIVRLAYMTALIPEIGHSALDVLADVPADGQTHMETDVWMPTIWISLRHVTTTNYKGSQENGWMLHVDPAATAKICLSKIPLDESEPLIRSFAKHSAVSFTNTLTYAGYKDVPASYLLCDADLCVPKAIQQKGIDMIEKEGGRKVTVTTIDSDHGPNHTAPQEVVKWILSVVAESAK